MSTAARVVSTSCDFDDSVLASRLNSCIRKSSRRPAGSPARRILRTSMTWLRSHVIEVRKILRAGEPAGRRLDFLMQEFNREANTLSSKSQDVETTRAAVDMKVLVEQMREQVQNVE